MRWARRRVEGVRRSAERGLVEAGGGEGKDLAAVVGDTDHVFELGGQAAVAGDGGPAVVEDFYLRATGVHHRLYGKEHALAQDRTLADTAEMQDVGGLVEAAADAVAAEIAHDAEALAFDKGL